MKKSGFTLAELLVVMAIMGFLAIIALSNTNKIVPNENMIMFKKAYSVTGQIVSSLIDDDDLYPDISDQDESKIGLGNTDGVKYKSDVERSGKTKFCYLFAEMLNVSSTIDCTDNQKSFTELKTPTGDFTTSDGIVWIMPKTTFSNNSLFYITIDINGDEGPNCMFNTKCKCSSVKKNSDGSVFCRRPEPDRFKFPVKRDGTMEVNNLCPACQFYLTTDNSSLRYNSRKQY